MSCPFCRLQPQEIVVENELAFGFADNYPLNPGHMLIIPKRHEPNFFALSEDEQAAIWRLVGELRAMSPARAFNVGINVGQTAGQTVPHAHVHLIPRYEGDVEDPRGGVRWVVPGKAAYWR